METPIYAIVGVVPVKAERDAKGVVRLHEYDEDTGGWVPNMRFLGELRNADIDVHFLSKPDFDAYVANLKK